MANKSLMSAVCASLVCIVTVAMQPAYALSFVTDATSDTTSGAASDPKGPATTGSLLSEVLVPASDGISYDFSGDGYARAAANDTGAGAVDANSAFFSGDPALNSVTALSELTSDVTNTSGGVVPFAYDFFLPGPQLTISDFAVISDTDDPTIRAFFDFRIQLDFGSGFVNHVVSQGELVGGIGGHTLGTAGTDPLNSTFFTDANFPNNIFGYQFDNLSGSITGNLADGQTVTAKTSLFVSLTAPGFETGGAASIGDPLNLSSGAFSGSLSIVPVPPAVWLFGSGLIGLIGIARRKQTV